MYKRPSRGLRSPRHLLPAGERLEGRAPLSGTHKSSAAPIPTVSQSVGIVTPGVFVSQQASLLK